MKRWLLSSAIGIWLGLRAFADVTLAPLFTDQAVLQRDKPLPIWGKAEVGEKIVVTFGGQSRPATTGYDGRWLVILDPLPATFIGSGLTVSGKNTVVLRNVVVGDVWLCSGQSHMESPVVRSPHARAEIIASNFPLIRQIEIGRAVANLPADTATTTGWQSASPQTVGNFSAIGYFFARDLHQKVGVPIGIVKSAWSGTPIESWMSPAALAAVPGFADPNQRGKDHSRGEGDPRTPAGLFNGMINPLLPAALCGVLWDHGESKVQRASDYHARFTAMITAWRAHFGQGDFPVLWVNALRPGVPVNGTPAGRSYAFLREAQTKALALPNTGQAIAIDIVAASGVGPTNFAEVGRRLALLALNRVYDVVTDDAGPTFAGATREGVGVREPVAVRYAWTDAPAANLYNGAGLPAVPFRSDAW